MKKNAIYLQKILTELGSEKNVEAEIQQLDEILKFFVKREPDYSKHLHNKMVVIQTIQDAYAEINRKMAEFKVSGKRKIHLYKGEIFLREQYPFSTKAEIQTRFPDIPLARTVSQEWDEGFNLEKIQEIKDMIKKDQVFWSKWEGYVNLRIIANEHVSLVVDNSKLAYSYHEKLTSAKVDLPRAVVVSINDTHKIEALWEECYWDKDYSLSVDYREMVQTYADSKGIELTTEELDILSVVFISSKDSSFKHGDIFLPKANIHVRISVRPIRSMTVEVEMI